MAKGTQNHPQVDLCGIRRAATLSGRRKIFAFPSSRSGRVGACRIFFRARRKCGGIFYAQKQEKEQVKVKEFRLCEKREKERARTGIRAPGTVCLQTRAVARRHDERRLSAIFRTPGGFCAAFCRFKKRQESATETVACLVVFLPQKTVQSISRINKWRRKMEYLLFFRRVKFKREDRVVLPLKFYHVKIL